MTPASSHDFVRAVRDALGLPPGTSRVVIEADVRQPLRVYAQFFPDRDAVPAVAAVLGYLPGAAGVEVVPVAEVSVSDRGGVDHVPFADGAPPADDFDRAQAEIDRLKSELAARIARGCRRTEGRV